jgi:predicted small secreted protein
MKSRLVLLAAVAMTAQNVSSIDINPDGTISEVSNQDKMLKSLKIFQGIRGSWIGFNRGLYGR